MLTMKSVFLFTSARVRRIVRERFAAAVGDLTAALSCGEHELRALELNEKSLCVRLICLRLRTLAVRRDTPV